MRHKDLTGRKFGMLTPISYLGNGKWLCKCDCGNEKIVTGGNLKRTKSCGCMRGKWISAVTTKHGGRKTPEYGIWCAMITRCETPSDTNYKNYGARGIKVCSKWRKSFADFLNDMGNRPTKRHSIERNNVNGNYEPSNCRWATKEEQMHNRRINKNNRTGIAGVFQRKNDDRFCAQIGIGGKRKHLGYFETLEEATEARQKAEQKYWKSSK